MISQFFILSPQRGDTLIFRDYRHDVPRDTSDLFIDRLKTWHKEHGPDQDPPPIFNVDGVQILFTNMQGLYFVCTTKFNVSTFMTFELLDRIAGLIRDFCGILSEECVRLNSSLIYELLDEVIDYGYPQTTSTDHLKSLIYEEPIPVKKENIIMNSLAKLKAHESSSNKPISKPVTHSRDEGKYKQNEVFIDIIERLVASFASDGMTIHSEINGSIQIKSYLQDNSEIRIILNSNISHGRDTYHTDDRFGIMFDDYKFHESVDSSNFEMHKQLVIFPPEGEITAMCYRISGDVSLPFRIFPQILDVPGSPNKMDVIIRIRADFPEDKIATNCTVIVPLPHITQSVSNEHLDGYADQSARYDSRVRKVFWTINKLKGGTEQSFKIKVTGANQFSPAAHLEIGPINLEFDIQNYTSSSIQIRRLKVFEKSDSLPPQRWVRYLTLAESYVFRI
ncbi:5952_t:CDS:10 [Scutellospora calospora]|uniref:5952_t:CDS:1 n=1 Tax=Scutellospora calospora TaxID=85575 RepID=A0ACA9JUN6_9GLOM|nr:5952_t:CDS:10 [Scutellospora calospora]